MIYEEVTPRGQRTLTETARFLSALFSTAAVAAMAMIAQALAGPAAGLATAALAGASWPLLQWAHFGTTESALVFLTAALTKHYVVGVSRNYLIVAQLDGRWRRGLRSVEISEIKGESER